MLSRKTILLLLLISFFTKDGFAQIPCGVLGQNPSTAFPVCGTAVFQQVSVPVCGGRNVPCVCPVTGTFQPFTDKNPFWYKFTCFSGGTLGFTITPNTLAEDYDWQLFDVTNHYPDEVYTNPALFVACNWSFDFGITGAAPPPLGNFLVECEGPGVPLFSAMPNLVTSHDYLLLVSHFSDSQSGYALSFGGGTAVITDTLPPHLARATAACDGSAVYIKLNKRMKCLSLSPGGAEFSLSPPVAHFISAGGTGCSAGFDMDSVSLTLDYPLPPGNYLVSIQNGPDGNTLTDQCNAAIPIGETIPLTVYPFVPTLMDSITTVTCAPGKLHLVFKRGIQCSSVAADGSDFLITGPTPVTVSGAVPACSNGLTPEITLMLQSPILTGGIYQLHLVRGSDGNTLVNDCFLETPVGSTLNFYTGDTVNADFNYTIRYGCKQDTVDYFHNGKNGVDYWKWNFDNISTGTKQNPELIYTSFGTRQTQLIVSNGICSDSSAFVPVFLDNGLKAAFEATAMVCPGEPALFLDKSVGTIVSWNWNFGNGNSSTVKTPPAQTYLPAYSNTEVPVKLLVQNNLGCKDSVLQKMIVGGDCRIAVPGAFTPNHDGLNDYLYPLNAYKVTGLLFRVYDRFGQLVFETRDFNNRWDGKVKGLPADAGTYVWLLNYTSDISGQRVEQKGTAILIR